MTAEHWLLALLSFATMFSMAWSMGRIMTALQRITASTEHIAQMVRELHNRSAPKGSEMLTTFVTLFVTMMLLAAAPAGAADTAVMSTPEHLVSYCAGQAGVSTDPHAALTPDQFRRLMWCVETNKHRIKAR